MARILLLSAYDAASHRSWRNGLQQALGDHDWTQLALAPRHFKWRVRGNSLWWAMEEAELLARPWDVLIATSMVDLAGLVGLVPALGAVRKVLYFHENQFAYPTRDQEFDMHLGALDLYSALAADRVLFNTRFNQQTMLEGVDWMLGRLPDFVPAGISERIEQRSAVVPVGIDDAWFGPRPARPAGPLRIAWNHRWEFDKGPDRFFAALRMLADRGVEFEVSVLGQRFRGTPPVFDEARGWLGERVRRWGWLDDLDAYRAELSSCDVVVSTALHEFQGLAVLEGAAAGCLPVVPDRLAYREIFPDYCRYRGHVDDGVKEAKRLADHLDAISRRLQEVRTSDPIDVRKFAWSRLAGQYRELLEVD